MEKHKTEPAEVLEGLKVIQNMKVCRNCRVNEAAEKPYVEMQKLDVGPLTGKRLRELVKGSDIPDSCAICYCLNEFFKLPESEQLKRLTQGQGIIN
ncbi:MAG: hypothetical protein ABSF65_05815 [Candidatus Bathyarchaeia archaeon]|jgi:hypothetical protein